VHQQFLDRCVVETLIDQAPYCLKNCGSASRAAWWLGLPSRTSVAMQAPVIAFDRLAINVGFCGSAP
jgi:hypothetical protein